MKLKIITLGGNYEYSGVIVISRITLCIRTYIVFHPGRYCYIEPAHSQVSTSRHPGTWLLSRLPPYAKGCLFYALQPGYPYHCHTCSTARAMRVRHGWQAAEHGGLDWPVPLLLPTKYVLLLLTIPQRGIPPTPLSVYDQTMPLSSIPARRRDAPPHLTTSGQGWTRVVNKVWIRTVRDIEGMGCTSFVHQSTRSLSSIAQDPSRAAGILEGTWGP